MPYLKTSKAGRHKRAARPEIRLVLPPVSHPQGLSEVLKSVIDDWLVPQLVDAFVRQMGFGSSGGLIQSDRPTESVENQPSPHQYGELKARQ